MSVPPGEAVLRSDRADGDAVVAPSITRRLLDAFAHQIPDPQRC
jgi:hypothetical protein